MSSGDGLVALPLTTVDAACCSEIAHYRQHGQGDSPSCLEIFRRALDLNQSDAWERLVNGCVGAQVRGRLLTHPAWPIARRYQDDQGYLTDTFARFWTWRAHRLAAGQSVRLDSFGGLVLFLHKCLHSAILEELRLWAPPGSWHKKAKGGENREGDEKGTGEEADADRSRADTQHWPSRTTEPREPESSSKPDEEALKRERLRAIWACARGEREQRVFVLRWHLGYPPSEIAARWPKMYPDQSLSADDISQMLQNILARYYRQCRKDEADAGST